MNTYQYVEHIIEEEINSISFKQLKINEWDRKYLIELIKKV